MYHFLHHVIGSADDGKRCEGHRSAWTALVRSPWEGVWGRVGSRPADRGGAGGFINQPFLATLFWHSFFNVFSWFQAPFSAPFYMCFLVLVHAVFEHDSGTDFAMFWARPLDWRTLGDTYSTA